MVQMTDPMRELTDMCGELNQHSDERGAAYLAKEFGVEAWSAEFFQILSVINRRIDDLVGLIARIDLEQDLRDKATDHLKQIRLAFSDRGLQNTWSTSVTSYINAANVGPIEMLSTEVRRIICYPKLDRIDVQLIIEQVDELVCWFEEHQLQEQDFIRQAIVEGLGQFRFRLDKAKWLGRGYALQSLREVIGAYMALQRNTPDANVAPMTEAVLRKTTAFIKLAWEKVTLAKDIKEDVDFILEAYGAVTLVAHVVAGLLPPPS